MRYALILVLIPLTSTVWAAGEYDISVEQAYAMWWDGAPVLDVRTQTEFEAGHIPGAILIPYNELEARIGEISAYIDTPMVVHCKSGSRGAIALAILLEQGFTEVHHMSDGFVAWQAAGYPVRTGAFDPDYTADANGDWVIDAVDVQTVINAVLALDVGTANPDVNRDDVINAADVQTVINAVLGTTGD